MAMTRMQNAARRGERGANLVETALVLGILLLLLAAAVDFGRVFQHYIVIANAAREGARYGSLYSGDADGISEAVIREAAGSGVTIAPADITISGLNAAPGERIEVEVTHRVSMLMGGFLGLDEMPLRSGTLMLAYAQ